MLAKFLCLFNNIEYLYSREIFYIKKEGKKRVKKNSEEEKEKNGEKSKEGEKKETQTCVKMSYSSE